MNYIEDGILIIDDCPYYLSGNGRKSEEERNSYGDEFIRDNQ